MSEGEQPDPGAAGARGSLAARLGGRSSFTANMLSNYLGRGWEAAMSVAFVPLYIRFLGAEAYGVVGIIAVIQSFMLILDFGLTPTLTREAARYESGDRDLPFFRDLVRSVELVVAGIALGIVALVALAAPFVAERWVRPESLDPATIAGALTIGGALIAMRFFESIFRGTLYGLERQAVANSIAALFATVRGLGSVAVIALTDLGLYGFLAFQAVASFATMLAMRAAVALALPRGGPKPRFSATALRSVGGFALGMVAISALSLAATQADKVVLSRLLSLESFGYYVFAANIALVLQLVAAPLMTTLYPRVIALIAKDDDAGLASFFHRWAKVVTLLTAPAAAWLVFFADPIILAWSGDAALAERSGAILSILAIGTFLHAQCVLPYFVQLAKGWTSLSIWTNAVALVATVPALLWFAPRFGALAGAWTWVAIASFYFFVALQLMFFKLLRGERWRFLIGDVAVPAASAFAVMAASAWWLPLGDGPIVLQLALLGLALALSFAAAAASAWMVERRGAQPESGGSGLAATASRTSP
jgi:O-antigen/teichoic acid export membrane protein